MGSLQRTFNFCRRVQLVSGAGTKVLRMFLEELSAPDTFKSYIYKHQSEVVDLRLAEDQEILITNRQVENMDITLLCRLIMKLFKNKLTQKQIVLVNGIKAERDQLVHSALLETTEISYDDYMRKRVDTEKMLFALSGEMTARVSQEIRLFIARINNSAPDIEEICETLREWCHTSPATEKYLDRINDALEQMRADFELNKLNVSSIHGFSAGLQRWLSVLFDRGYERYKRSLGVPDPFHIGLKDKALDHLQTPGSSIVVLQGQNGSGKTKGAFSLAHTLTLNKFIKTERCALIRNPSELNAVNPNDLDLLVIDDIGNNRYMTPVWEESLRILEKLLGNSNMKVIITTRVPLNLEFKTVKGTIKLASHAVKLQDLDTWQR